MGCGACLRPQWCASLTTCIVPPVSGQLDFNLPERFDMFYVRCGMETEEGYRGGHLQASLPTSGTLEGQARHIPAICTHSDANVKERPIMIHRAILGSLERFMGILIENYAGEHRQACWVGNCETSSYDLAPGGRASSVGCSPV